MLHAEGIGIFGNGGETADERIGETVGNLEGNAKEHGKDEEKRHFFLLEQEKGFQTHGFGQGFLLTRASTDRAGRQGMGINGQQKPPSGTDKELEMRILKTKEIHNPHRADKTYRPENPDGRKILDRVQPCFIQCIVCHRIGQGQGGHIKGHAEGIECEQPGE